MKKQAPHYIFSSTYLIVFLMFSFGFSSQAQDSTQFRLGEGLILSLNAGDYTFGLGGNIKTAYSYTRDTSKLLSNKHGFHVRRGQFLFKGTAKKEKFRFYILADFIETWSLLEAWTAFDVAQKHLSITVGQKLVNTNNKELINHQNYFQFSQSSLLSRRFSRLGREFGLFIDGKWNLGQIVLKPSISITSGDGINSFGNGTTDRFDYGGVKFGGRLDILPFGNFTSDNNFLGADLIREKKPKLALGIAASSNQGASDKVGEGHGNIMFYSQNINGSFRDAYPNYQKIYADLLFKYKGFNLGLEFVNSYATEVFGLFTDPDPNNQTPIYRGDIAESLVLGMGFNAQLGYTLPNFWSFDLRYTRLIPEFDTNLQSLLVEEKSYIFGISKFFKGQAFKIQLQGEYHTFDETINTIQNEKTELSAQFSIQLIF